MGLKKNVTNKIYVPETQTIAQTMENVARNKGMKLEFKGQHDRERETPAQRRAGREAARMAELTAKINAPAPRSSTPPLRPGEDQDASFLTLTLEDIVAYDRNPRTTQNPKHAEIKASIRDRGGLQGNLTVTRRPDTAKYMLYMGGNTRLAILKELYAETGDRKFFVINCSYREWKGEADVMASHLIENEARGDTLFIEKARGLVMLMKELGRETGQAVTSRNVANRTRSLGMSIGATAALLYEFAAENLEILGPSLTYDNVAAIKRRAGQHEAVAEALHRAGELGVAYPAALAELQRQFVTRLQADVRSTQDEETEDQKPVAGPLRGERLREFIAGMDGILATVLGLNAGAARRITAALDTAGKDNLSVQTVRAVIAGHAPTDESASTSPSAKTTPSTEVTTNVSTATAPPCAPPTRIARQTPAPLVETPSNPGTATAQAITEPSLAGAREATGATMDVPAPLGANDVLTDERMREFAAWFFALLNDWCVTTRIAQWFQWDNNPALPYLFWLELPEEVATQGGYLSDLADPEFGRLDRSASRLRSASYRLVALLSGQLGCVIRTPEGHPTDYRRFARRLPEASLWRQAAMVEFDSEDVFYNVWEQRLGGVTSHRTCEMSLAQEDLLEVMRVPHLAERWCALSLAYDQWGQVLARMRALEGVDDLVDDLSQA